MCDSSYKYEYEWWWSIDIGDDIHFFLLSYLMKIDMPEKSIQLTQMSFWSLDTVNVPNNDSKLLSQLNWDLLRPRHIRSELIFCFENHEYWLFQTKKKLALVRSCFSQEISGMRFTYCCVGIMVIFRNNDTPRFYYGKIAILSRMVFFSPFSR
jgi:hypothetical protein